MARCLPSPSRSAIMTEIGNARLPQLRRIADFQMPLLGKDPMRRFLRQRGAWQAADEQPRAGQKREPLEFTL